MTRKGRHLKHSDGNKGRYSWAQGQLCIRVCVHVHECIECARVYVHKSMLWMARVLTEVHLSESLSLLFLQPLQNLDWTPSSPSWFLLLSPTSGSLSQMPLCLPRMISPPHYLILVNFPSWWLHQPLLNPPLLSFNLLFEKILVFWI